MANVPTMGSSPTVGVGCLDIGVNMSSSGNSKRPSAESQQVIVGDPVYGDQIAGDKVGGDKIAVGDVGGSYNAIGAGAQVNIFHAAPSTPEKPRLPFEPETILVPAGPFLMGDNDDPLSAPQSPVDLPAFRISLYPITNEQFVQFIRQTNRAASSDLLWEGNRPPRDRLRHPVMGITWQEALAFCDWLTELTERPYSLPSEAQWEKAARGELTCPPAPARANNGMGFELFSLFSRND